MSTLAIVATAAAVVLLAAVGALYRIYMAGTAKGYTWSFGAKWSPPATPKPVKPAEATPGANSDTASRPATQLPRRAGI
jgi:hypothetical protein